MKNTPRTGPITGMVAAGAGTVLGGYAAYAAFSWYRYGRVQPAVGKGAGDPIDRYMPTYEIVERHHLRVRAPASLTFAVACEQDLFDLPLVRAIFRARENILGAAPDRRARPRGLIAAVRALGWGVLDEIPQREIVMGAVTKPWEPNVTFQAVAPEAFAEFSQPGLVKIAWTLRADPVDERASIFRTETRAVATDSVARSRFRRYWALASPGISLIRLLSLPPLKCEAERRARKALSSQGSRGSVGPAMALQRQDEQAGHAE